VSRYQRHLPWLAGFLLSVNLYLVPAMAGSPRMTDLCGLMLGLWAIWRLARGAVAAGQLALVGAALLLPVGWCFFGLLGGDMPTVTQSARWVLAAPWALALALIPEDEDRRRRFAWGLVIGGGVNVLVIVAQSLGFESVLRVFGLSSAGAAYHHWVGYVVRIPGLHGYHNASSAIISLLVPAGLYLYFRRQMPLWIFLAALGGMAIALHLTSTRSPIVVTIGTVMFAALTARRLGRVVVVGFVLLTVAVPLVMAYGPPGGWSRWKNVEAVSVNVRERVESTVGAAELTLEYPVGVGVTKGKEVLADKTGIAATHNAFLQAALFFGLPLSLLVMLGMGTSMFRALEGTDSPHFLMGLLSVHMIGLFMFEEHLNNATFVILALWCIVALGRARRAPASGAEDLPPVA